MKIKYEHLGFGILVIVIVGVVLFSGCVKQYTTKPTTKETTSQEEVTGVSNAQRNFDRGIEYYDQGKIDLAVSELERAIELDSANTNYYYRLARTYSEAGKPDKAIETWKAMPKEDLPVPEAKPYKKITEKPTGWFKKGEKADLILYATGFNDSGGPLFLNHPSRVATDGNRLIVSDTWNNRVLIWNNMPNENNKVPDLVLGQPDFKSNVAGLGPGRMNWPMGVATDGEKLLVSDANNDRVLIWNEFPIENGQHADLVLGAPDFNTWPNYYDREHKRNSTRRIYWPWDVWTNGEKVIVTSTTDGSVLVWNKFPTKNNQPADMILGPQNFTNRFGKGDSYFKTPRAIACDGHRLAIGDYNAGSVFMWDEFPIKNGQDPDFTIKPSSHPYIMGATLHNNQLFVSNVNQILIWNNFPKKASQSTDLILGAERKREETLLMPHKERLFSDSFEGPYGTAVAGEKLIVADTDNNRVLIFNKVPSVSFAKADVVLGAPDFQTNSLVSRNSFFNPMPFSDGERLIVGADGFGAFIYNNIPDEDKSEADIVVGRLLRNTIVGGHTITVGDKMVMVHREGSSVFIWDSIPKTDNELPDIVLGKEVYLDNWGRAGKGRTAMNGPQMAASDGKRLFITDTGNNRVLIWNKVPTKSQTPADIVLGQPDFESTFPGSSLDQMNRPIQISTDGKRLVVADQSNNRVLVWKTIPTKNNRPADFEIKRIAHSTSRLSMPSGTVVHNGHLFIADNGNNRVLVWNEFPENATKKPDLVIGQKDFQSNYPSNSKSGFFVPSYIDFDGSFLWVGEMKWSNRLLRFDVQPNE